MIERYEARLSRVEGSAVVWDNRQNRAIYLTGHGLSQNTSPVEAERLAIVLNQTYTDWICEK